MANFTTDSIIIIQKQEVISIEDIHILKPPCQESRIRLLLATLRLCARCLILNVLGAVCLMEGTMILMY